MKERTIEANCRACTHSGMEPSGPAVLICFKFSSIEQYLQLTPLPECGWASFEQHPLRNPDGSFKMKLPAASESP